MTCSKHTTQAQIIIVPECPKVARLELKVFNQCGEQNSNLNTKATTSQDPHTVFANPFIRKAT